MKKILIWGAGKGTMGLLESPVLLIEYIILAIIDNNSQLWGTRIKDYEVISPDNILKYDFDYILIASLYADDIFKQIVINNYLERKKIIFKSTLEKELVKRIEKKYEKTNDKEIKNILDSYKNKAFSIFGSYELKEEPFYFVNYDEEENPYIIFEGKRMYFPRNYVFRMINGKKYINNILAEQGENSPHLYLRSGEEITNNSIIVDAGVCEGNFSLRYIEKAKKMYLIEADQNWIEPLEKTFRPYKNKVVLCNKYLSKYDSKNTITLDTLVKEKIDFLKMDIEGAEIDALLGGIQVLKRSDARCSICSYHNSNDEKYIKLILDSCGYNTSCSEGRMFFIYDEKIIDSMDFRKGVVYGTKVNNRENII